MGDSTVSANGKPTAAAPAVTSTAVRSRSPSPSAVDDGEAECAEATLLLSRVAKSSAPPTLDDASSSLSLVILNLCLGDSAAWISGSGEVARDLMREPQEGEADAF